MKAYGITYHGDLYDCMDTEKAAQKLLKTDPLMVYARNVSRDAVIELLDPIDCTQCHNYIEADGGCPGLLEDKGGE